MKSSIASTCLRDISNISDYTSSNKIPSNSTDTNIFKSPYFKIPLSPLCSDSIQSTTFLSANQGEKRVRSSIHSAENKKSIKGSKPVTKLVTELIDPENGKTVAFRCYFEKDLADGQVQHLNFINNECDDDCPTDLLQIETCKEFLIRDLEKILINV